ncbi:MAG TPA: ATP-binding protein [Polyangiaceae bacterium]|nr:ATP-binding protein [Polyangiaceae bacterium]
MDDERPVKVMTPAEGHAVGSTRGAGEALPPGRPRRALSIQQKLVGVIVAVVVFIVTFLSVYLSYRHIGELRAILLQKATMYGRLVSKQVESAVAFGDRETAREVFEAIAQDSAVEASALYTSNDNRLQLLEARGSLAVPASWLEVNLVEQRVVSGDGYVLVVAPVVSLEGPRGVLALQLSTQALERSRSDVMRAAAMAGMAALLIGVLASFVIGGSVAKRLRAVARTASAVAAGDLEQPPVEDEVADEIGTMAAAFNVMLARLKSLIERIHRDAREEQARLEHLVRERTRELDDRNRDMRRVLDNVVQGLLTIDRHGVISSEHSAIVEKWFGRVPCGATLGAYLDKASPGFGFTFDLAWSQVVEDMLPLALALVQLPREIRAQDRIFELEFGAITDADGQLERVLVVISDMTAAMKGEQAENDEREVVQLFTKALDDRAAVTEFLHDAQLIVDQIVSASSTDPSLLQRPVHTLKGNAGCFGLATLVKSCDDIETALADNEVAVAERCLARLSNRWSQITAKLGVLRVEVGSGMAVDPPDYDALVSAVSSGVPKQRLLRMLQDWKLEPIALRFRRIAAQVQHWAERLDRGPVDVRVEADGLRTCPEQWASFWSVFVHVVRNAVDHGLEPRNERIRLGKPEKAFIVLRATHGDGQLRIEIEDSGRGIDWTRLRAAAEGRGLAATTRGDLIEAMFTDGVTTRDQVTDVSGRGVGLGAVLSVCRSMGGTIEVDSTPGRGTKIAFVWPNGVAADLAAAKQTILTHPM